MFASSIACRLLHKRFSSSVEKSLRIVVLASTEDGECLKALSKLPPNAVVISQGANVEEIRLRNPDFVKAECLLVVSGSSSALANTMKEMRNLQWIHGIFAGLDHMRGPEFDSSTKNGIVVTNAKG